jgi:hypothetical protein
MNLIRYAAVASLALAMSAISPAAPSVTVSAQDVSAASGFFAYTGGGVRGMRARTQTAASAIGSPGAWVGVAGAIIAYTIPSLTTDVLDVSFTAECQKILGGRTRIRLLDTVSGSTSSFEPNDGDSTFCSSASTATYHASWLKRAGAGTHNLQVQLQNTSGQVIIDDWKFQLVIYD